MRAVVGLLEGLRHGSKDRRIPDDARASHASLPSHGATRTSRVVCMRPELQSYRHLASGKVREIYEIDADTLLLVATDRISAYDHILSPAIGDKGRILTAMSFFWFDVLGVPNHLAGGHRRAHPRRGRRPLHGGAPAADGAGRVRRPRLPDRLRPRRLPGHRFGVRGGAAAGAHRGVQAARADLHPGHQGGAGRPRREHQLRARRRAGGCRAGRGPARRDPRHLQPRCGAGRRARDHPRRHQVRVRTRRQRGTRARRRGADAGLVALLGGRHLRAGQGAAELRQTDRAELAHRSRIRLGQGLRHPAAALPDDVVERTRARYIEAYEWITQKSFDEWPDAEVGA